MSLRVEKRSLWTVATTALAVAVSLAWLVGAPVAEGASVKERSAAAARLQKQNQAAYDLSRAFGRAAAYVMPAVVSITVEKTVGVISPGRQLPPHLWEMPSPFGRRGPQRMPQRRGEQREFKMPGLGSGFVIDSRGYVVTNWHVVQGAEIKDIRVMFRDGSAYTPVKVLQDSRSDIAVLKIEGGPFDTVELGESGQAMPGQWVLAVGSPSGFGFSVSAGVVSARSTKNRMVARNKFRDFRAMDDRYAQEDYIQTDTTINPGNSGGPLVDLYGRVIGVNTLIFSRTGQYGGLCFAVPSDKVRRVTEQLIRTGRVTRGHLGVEIIERSIEE